jgi:hypothetical protein
MFLKRTETLQETTGNSTKYKTCIVTLLPQMTLLYKKMFLSSTRNHSRFKELRFSTNFICLQLIGRIRKTGRQLSIPPHKKEGGWGNDTDIRIASPQRNRHRRQGNFTLDQCLEKQTVGTFPWQLVQRSCPVLSKRN